MKTCLPIFAILLMLLTYACNNKAKTNTNENPPSISQPAPMSPAELKPGGPITGIHWKLTEIIGKPLSQFVTTKNEAYIMLKEDGTVEANGGCNGMSGTYEIMDGGKVKFSEMTSTKIACPDMTVEDNLVRVFKHAEQYFSDGKTLILERTGFGTIARFEAGS